MTNYTEYFYYKNNTNHNKIYTINDNLYILIELFSLQNQENYNLIIENKNIKTNFEILKTQLLSFLDKKNIIKKNIYTENIFNILDFNNYLLYVKKLNNKFNNNISNYNHTLNYSINYDNYINNIINQPFDLNKENYNILYYLYENDKLRFNYYIKKFEKKINNLNITTMQPNNFIILIKFLNDPIDTYVLYDILLRNHEKKLYNDSLVNENLFYNINYNFFLKYIDENSIDYDYFNINNKKLDCSEFLTNDFFTNLNFLEYINYNPEKSLINSQKFKENLYTLASKKSNDSSAYPNPQIQLNAILNMPIPDPILINNYLKIINKNPVVNLIEHEFKIIKKNILDLNLDTNILYYNEMYKETQLPKIINNYDYLNILHTLDKNNNLLLKNKDLSYENANLLVKKLGIFIIVLNLLIKFIRTKYIAEKLKLSRDKFYNKHIKPIYFLLMEKIHKNIKESHKYFVEQNILDKFFDNTNNYENQYNIYIENLINSYKS